MSIESGGFFGSDSAGVGRKAPPGTEVACNDCGWKGPMEACGTDRDQDGWEQPEYEVLVCPKCGSWDVEI